MQSIHPVLPPPVRQPSAEIANPASKSGALKKVIQEIRRTAISTEISAKISKSIISGHFFQPTASGKTQELNIIGLPDAPLTRGFTFRVGREVQRTIMQAIS